MVKGQRVGKLWLFLGNGYRPWAAVLQQFPVLNIRMADSPVSEEASLLSHSSRLYQQRGNGSVNIRLAYDRDSLFIEDRVGRARHDAKFCLKRIPALDRSCLAAILVDQLFHGDRKGSHILHFVVLDLYFHVFTDVRDHFRNLGSLFLDRLYFFCKFRHRDRRQLDIELLQKFTFITHRGPEVKRPGRDLKDPDIAECLYHVAHRQKVP